MRLLLLTDHFAPGRSSGARLMTGLAGGLAAGDIDLEVITARERAVVDHTDALPVHRVPLPLGRARSTALRLFSEVLFSLFAAAALAARRRGRDHALILASPPFLPLFAGPVARLLGLTYSVVLMDVYPDMAARLGRIPAGGVVYRLWDRWLVRVLEWAAGVVVIGECMKAIVEAKSDRISATVIPNWVDGEDVAPVPPERNEWLAERPELSGRFVVLYAGNLGLAQDFEPLLGAAELALGDRNLAFALVGDGARRREIESRIRAGGLVNVHLYPFADPALQGQFLSAAGVALITLQSGVEGLAVPSKFYPIIATGRPVIAILDPASEVGSCVIRHDLGLVLQHPTAADLHRAICELRDRTDDYSTARIRGVFERYFDAPIAMARYRDFMAGHGSPLR